ncbi:MAG: GNAT family N-acetyltransferase [Halobacteriales archaeon]
MACRIIGWPDQGPRLDLDHEAFAYAGKFVMTNTGKSVLEDADDPLAAVAFSRDRTDERVWWLRTVTVRRDRQGEGLGPRLLDFTADRMLDPGQAVRIAVNNPYAYEAAYKAGFGYTGGTTGLAELVLERPSARAAAAYRAGLERYRERDDLSADARTFLESRDGSVPPLRAGNP